MKPLFVYGTLQPGHDNAWLLEQIGGEWLAGSVSGTYYARGWGAAADFPGVVLSPEGRAYRAICFSRRISTRTGRCSTRLKRDMIACP